MIKSVIAFGMICASLCGCRILDSKTPEYDLYLGVRIVNNDLGKLLKEYHATVKDLAQKQVDSESARDCQPNDSICRLMVKDRVADQYELKQSQYNRIADVQNGTALLIQIADNACAVMTEDLCEEAKNNVLKNKRDVENGWNIVSSWVR